MDKKTKKSIQEYSSCVVPRNFILIDSIERANQFANVTYGIVPDDDDENKGNSTKLENWTGTIIYDDGKELYIIEVTMKIPLEEEFYVKPPIIKFAPHCLEFDKVKRMVNDDGTINNKYLAVITWDAKKMGIGEYLTQVYDRIRAR